MPHLFLFPYDMNGTLSVCIYFLQNGVKVGSSIDFLFDIYQTDLYLLTVVFDKQLKIDG